MIDPALVLGTLPNGLRTAFLPAEGRRLALVTLYFRTGSRFESTSDNGLSHLLEHMLFRGVPSRASSHALAASFEDLGGMLEASTAADHGNLTIVLPHENVATSLELLAEVFRAPLFEDLDLERSIIKEEILEDYDESGHLIDASSLVRALSFGDHGLGRPITGPATNLDHFDLAAIRRHHAETHVAVRTVIGVAGSFDVDLIGAAIAAGFERVPRGHLPSCEPPAAQTAPRLSFVRHGGGSQTSIALGYRAPSAASGREPAIDMLLRVLDDGMSTRLYHQLIDQRGLCYDASSHYEAYGDAGLVEIHAHTAHERTNDVTERILGIVDDLASEHVTSEELDRARRRARWQFEALVDEPVDLGDFTAFSLLSDVETSPARRLERLLDVTPDEIREAAARTFAGAGRSTVVVGDPPRRAERALESLAHRP